MNVSQRHRQLLISVSNRQIKEVQFPTSGIAEVNGSRQKVQPLCQHPPVNQTGHTYNNINFKPSFLKIQIKNTHFKICSFLISRFYVQTTLVHL